MSEQPLWLAKAWRIRGVLLTAVLAVIFLAIHARLTASGGGPLVPLLPLLFLIAVGVALGADWLWLKRNHHRISEWGLNRGREFRKKPK